MSFCFVWHTEILVGHSTNPFQTYGQSSDWIIETQVSFGVKIQKDLWNRHLCHLITNPMVGLYIPTIYKDSPHSRWDDDQPPPIPNKSVNCQLEIFILPTFQSSNRWVSFLKAHLVSIPNIAMISDVRQAFVRGLQLQLCGVARHQCLDLEMPSGVSEIRWLKVQVFLRVSSWPLVPWVQRGKNSTVPPQIWGSMTASSTATWTFHDLPWFANPKMNAAYLSKRVELWWHHSWKHQHVTHTNHLWCIYLLFHLVTFNGKNPLSFGCYVFLASKKQHWIWKQVFKRAKIGWTFYIFMAWLGGDHLMTFHTKLLDSWKYILEN